MPAAARGERWGARLYSRIDLPSSLHYQALKLLFVYLWSGEGLLDSRVARVQNRQPGSAYGCRGRRPRIAWASLTAYSLRRKFRCVKLQGNSNAAGDCGEQG
uniref:Uncharacterized protein n=1 Tax=Ralstonia syzygii R24 TaxID=907261 RepID=G3A3Z5_9RALS|nr:hypothetical protein RALSY_30364 [Ralstonia syzygii R24]